MLAQRNKPSASSFVEVSQMNALSEKEQFEDTKNNQGTPSALAEQNKLLKVQLGELEQLLKKVAEWSDAHGIAMPYTLSNNPKQNSWEPPTQSISRTASKDSLTGKARSSCKTVSTAVKPQEDIARRQMQQNFDRRMKVALADSEFEVKRLNEDFAMFKTLQELERAKLTKEFENRITHLKAQLDEDNQNWINRFDIRDKEFKAEGELLRQSLEKDKEQIRQGFQKKLKCIKKEIEEEHVKITQEQSKKHTEEVKKLQAEREVEMQRILLNHEQEINKIRGKHEQEIQRMRCETQILLVAVRSERKTEENMHESTKSQMNRLKEKLYSELYEVRKDNDLLSLQVTRLEKDKKALEIRLEQERDHLSQVLEKHEVAFNRLREQYESRQTDLKQVMKSKIAEILERQLEKAEELGSNIKGTLRFDLVLEQRHSQQVELFSTQMEQIKNCYQERPSRQEDLQMIRQLEEKLWKKEGDLELVCQELKWHRLELENKEETYNKIFTNGYNVNVNELKFPAERTANRTATKEFKFRRVAKSLLTKDPKNSSGKLLQTNMKIL